LLGDTLVDRDGGDLSREIDGPLVDNGGGKSSARVDA
jgi:hypothetical protein